MSEITKCPHCGADARECTWIICDQPMRAPYCYERQLAQKEAEFAEFAALYTDLENHFVWAKDKLEQKEAEIARLHKMLMGDNEGALLLSDLTETAKTRQAKIAALESALRGVIRVADRDTVEFNAAKDALK